MPRKATKRTRPSREIYFSAERETKLQELLKILHSRNTSDVIGQALDLFYLAKSGRTFEAFAALNIDLRPGVRLDKEGDIIRISCTAITPEGDLVTTEFPSGRGED